MSRSTFQERMYFVTHYSPIREQLTGFISDTMDRHNVHFAPWTAALTLNFMVALDAYNDKLTKGPVEECMKLSKWLVDASMSLQESFIKAGTPAPSGPAEVYADLLAKGYQPPDTDACAPKIRPLLRVPDQEPAPESEPTP